MRVQNSLNFQEEVDKKQISLNAANEIEKGTQSDKLDEDSKKFIRGEPA